VRRWSQSHQQQQLVESEHGEGQQNSEHMLQGCAPGMARHNPQVCAPGMARHNPLVCTPGMAWHNPLVCAPGMAWHNPLVIEDLLYGLTVNTLPSGLEVK
jgi:hypothetical protein